MDLEKLLMQINSGSPATGAAVGDLPCEATIGMTYTPLQRGGSEKFEPQEALSRGTLYPGLEMPWMNNFNVAGVPKTPLGELQALDFCVVELGLYLDTHPNDSEALELYRAFQLAYKEKREAYVRRYGPLSTQDIVDSDEYNWISDPWPWDVTRRRGV